MKIKFILLIFYIITLNFANFPQEPDPYSFFPSAVGNVWEYNSNTGLRRYEIIRDSILSDNSKYIYYAINTEPIYRIDTLFNVFWTPTDINWLYYKLDADSGDTWVADTYVSEKDTFYTLAHVRAKYPASVFERPTTVMEILYQPDQPDTTINEDYPGGFVDYLAAGIGLIQEWDIEGGPTMILRGCIIDGDTIGTVITSVDKIIEVPSGYKLYQNYPNPFNPATTISYNLSRISKVEVEIYDVLGNKIKSFFISSQPAGKENIIWNGTNSNGEQVSSGIYLYHFKAVSPEGKNETFERSAKLIMMK